jgi:single-strand DNA-binding protein
MPAPPNKQAEPAKRQQERKNSYEDIGPGSVSGNLTRNPELRYTPEGRAVVTLRIAETERVRDDDSGSWKDGETQFYDVIVWGDQGEHATESLEKGDRIAAVGSWQVQKWTDPEGQERSKTVLVARDVGPSLLFRQVKVVRERKGQQRP